MSIRAIVFDFGNVVCFFPTEEQRAEAAQFCGVNVAEFRRASGCIATTTTVAETLPATG
jgi:hypothetical protein